jgi:CheY-like chemotaxis protein/anti-sigma regulatory factor (Ser/Thr protein kinase)
VQQNSRTAEWAGVNLKVVHCNLYVQTDPTLLTTMIQNIITNAIKYAGNGPVLIGCRRRGGLLAVEIHDRGPGIGREHLDRVFEEFYQVRERGDKDVEGVGLGLPIVRRLSRLLGLNVHIRSRKGYGTAVIIEDLQIIPAPKQISGSSRPYVPVSVMEGLRVLLVEDDEDVLVATASLLEKWGCVVQAETTVPECEAHCDVVITDFDLGAKTTGADCIARVRAMNRRKVPAVIMTGHDENRVREELGDQEIPVLAKPVRPTELRSLVIAIAIEMKSG